MSTASIGAACERDDPILAVRAPQIAAEPSNELTGIATAIERVEALLGACDPWPESADAIERIADIAFVLHEREVEASLCDALDAAVRELGNANAVKQANVQHVRQAAELLRELSHSVADMIALLQVSPPPAANDIAAMEIAPQEVGPAAAEQQASEDMLDGEIPRKGLFTEELLDDDEFARAVAELAASLPALAEPAEAVVVTPRQDDRNVAANEPALAPETEAAITQAEHEPVSTGEFALTPELDEAAPETADFAADEPLAPEPNEAFAEALRGGADLTTKAAAFAPAFKEVVAETRRESAALPPDESALAPAQQPPAIRDQSEATGQVPAEESATVESADEQLLREEAVGTPDAAPEARNDEDTASATPVSESALGNTPSGAASMANADIAVPLSDSAARSARDSSASEHAAVSPSDADTASSPAAALSPLAPEELPESETVLAPDDAPAAVIAAEPELRPSESPRPPDLAIAVELAPDQIMASDNRADGPAQIAGDSHAPDGTVVEPAAEVGEEPPCVNESSQLLPELALVDPQDDPGDLFEPLAATAPPIATVEFAGAERENEISAPAAPTQAHSAARASNPLAVMHTFSAEELLALFT